MQGGGGLHPAVQRHPPCAQHAAQQAMHPIPSAEPAAHGHTDPHLWIGANRACPSHPAAPVLPIPPSATAAVCKLNSPGPSMLYSITYSRRSSLRTSCSSSSLVQPRYRAGLLVPLSTATAICMTCGSRIGCAGQRAAMATLPAMALSQPSCKDSRPQTQRWMGRAARLWMLAHHGSKAAQTAAAGRAPRCMVGPRQGHPRSTVAHTTVPHGMTHLLGCQPRLQAVDCAARAVCRPLLRERVEQVVFGAKAVQQQGVAGAQLRPPAPKLRQGNALAEGK